ncbi:unnamed protein product, partial [Mesorhabditis belari]|uniref:START domain-containing protein 10 n=1 Tax=Mesorhabditis belari TaxID=2138241 RepID=A0AAF3EBQ2_9BILA
MRVNVARIFEDTDYAKIQTLCESTEGWTQVYHKHSTSVWVQMGEGDFQVIRARTHLSDVSASTLYDVLHDPDYRPKWDRHMTASQEIGMLNPNNDLCYYALSSVPPIRPRDFVMQRSWLDAGDEKLICSHSVCHDDFPPQKGYIRATIFKAGYRILRRGDGCEVTYVTHSDPKGKLPAWLINRLTRVVAPKLMKKVHKAALNYLAWKKDHRPHWKPWLFPEQMLELRKISLSECTPRTYDQEIVDESRIGEKEIAADDD